MRPCDVTIQMKLFQKYFPMIPLAIQWQMNSIQHKIQYCEYFFFDFTSKSASSKWQKEIEFMLQNTEIQIAPCESAAEEVAYEWPYHRILSTDSIVATSVELPPTATYWATSNGSLNKINTGWHYFEIILIVIVNQQKQLTNFLHCDLTSHGPRSPSWLSLHLNLLTVKRIGVKF